MQVHGVRGGEDTQRSAVFLVALRARVAALVAEEADTERAAILGHGDVSCRGGLGGAAIPEVTFSTRPAHVTPVEPAESQPEIPPPEGSLPPQPLSPPSHVYRGATEYSEATDGHRRSRSDSEAAAAADSATFQTPVSGSVGGPDQGAPRQLHANGEDNRDTPRGDGAATVDGTVLKRADVRSGSGTIGTGDGTRGGCGNVGGPVSSPLRPVVDVGRLLREGFAAADIAVVEAESLALRPVWMRFAWPATEAAYQRQGALGRPGASVLFLVVQIVAVAGSGYQSWKLDPPTEHPGHGAGPTHWRTILVFALLLPMTVLNLLLEVTRIVFIRREILRQNRGDGTVTPPPAHTFVPRPVPAPPPAPTSQSRSHSHNHIYVKNEPCQHKGEPPREFKNDNPYEQENTPENGRHTQRRLDDTGLIFEKANEDRTLRRIALAADVVGFVFVLTELLHTGILIRGVRDVRCLDRTQPVEMVGSEATQRFYCLYLIRENFAVPLAFSIITRSPPFWAMAFVFTPLAVALIIVRDLLEQDALGIPDIVFVFQVLIVAFIWALQLAFRWFVDRADRLHYADRVRAEGRMAHLRVEGEALSSFARELAPRMPAQRPKRQARTIEGESNSEVEATAGLHSITADVSDAQVHSSSDQGGGSGEYVAWLLSTRDYSPNAVVLTVGLLDHQAFLNGCLPTAGAVATAAMLARVHESFFPEGGAAAASDTPPPDVAERTAVGYTAVFGFTGGGLGLGTTSMMGGAAALRERALIAARHIARLVRVDLQAASVKIQGTHQRMFPRLCFALHCGPVLGYFPGASASTARYCLEGGGIRGAAAMVRCCQAPARPILISAAVVEALGPAVQDIADKDGPLHVEVDADTTLYTSITRGGVNCKTSTGAVAAAEAVADSVGMVNRSDCTAPLAEVLAATTAVPPPLCVYASVTIELEFSSLTRYVEMVEEHEDIEEVSAPMHRHRSLSDNIAFQNCAEPVDFRHPCPPLEQEKRLSQEAGTNDPAYINATPSDGSLRSSVLPDPEGGANLTARSATADPMPSTHSMSVARAHMLLSVSGITAPRCRPTGPLDRRVETSEEEEDLGEERQERNPSDTSPGQGHPFAVQGGLHGLPGLDADRGNVGIAALSHGLAATRRLLADTHQDQARRLLLEPAPLVGYASTEPAAGRSRFFLWERLRPVRFQNPLVEEQFAEYQRHGRLRAPKITMDILYLATTGIVFIDFFVSAQFWSNTSAAGLVSSDELELLSSKHIAGFVIAFFWLTLTFTAVFVRYRQQRSLLPEPACSRSSQNIASKSEGVVDDGVSRFSRRGTSACTCGPDGVQTVPDPGRPSIRKVLTGALLSHSFRGLCGIAVLQLYQPGVFAMNPLVALVIVTGAAFLDPLPRAPLLLPQLVLRYALPTIVVITEVWVLPLVVVEAFLLVNFVLWGSMSFLTRFLYDRRDRAGFVAAEMTAALTAALAQQAALRQAVVVGSAAPQMRALLEHFAQQGGAPAADPQPTSDPMDGAVHPTDSDDDLPAFAGRHPTAKAASTTPLKNTRADAAGDVGGLTMADRGLGRAVADYGAVVRGASGRPAAVAELESVAMVRVRFDRLPRGGSSGGDGDLLVQAAEDAHGYVRFMAAVDALIAARYPALAVIEARGCEVLLGGPWGPAAAGLSATGLSAAGGDDEGLEPSQRFVRSVAGFVAELRGVAGALAASAEMRPFAVTAVATVDDALVLMRNPLYPAFDVHGPGPSRLRALLAAAPVGTVCATEAFARALRHHPAAAEEQRRWGLLPTGADGDADGGRAPLPWTVQGLAVSRVLVLPMD